MRRSYDQISRAYRGDSVGRERGYFAWLAALTPLLQPGEAILDLGCGFVAFQWRKNSLNTFASPSRHLSSPDCPGTPARPQATFLCADMTTLWFPPDAFAAIVSFFAIIHLPVYEHRPLLERCFTWLQPGGYLMATVGHQAWTGYKDEWYGAPMYWSHADEATYLTWFQELGFTLLWTRFIPEGDGGHVLVCVRRPAQ